MSARARLPIAAWLLIALLALCAGGKAILYDTLDPDCFWHLRVADQLLRDGIGPLVDHISFASQREPWTPYSWLAELGMKGVWDLGGYRAAIFVQALLSALFVVIIAIIVNTTDNENDERRSALATTSATAFAAFLSLAYLSFRPATLAIVLLAVCYLLLNRHRSKDHQTRLVWLVVPITGVLANVHLYVFLVPLWIAAVLMGDLFTRCEAASGGIVGMRRGRSVILLIATSLAALATPMLPGMIQIVVHYQFRDAMVAGPAIAEMLPFWQGPMGKISALLVVGFFVTLFINRRRLTPADWFLIAGSTALLLLHGRYAPLFAIVAAPLLARTLPKFSDAPLTRPIFAPALSALLIIGIIRLTFAFPSHSTTLAHWLNRHGPQTPGYPTQAADFLAANIPPRTGRLINEFTWGGYLAWRVGDRYQVLLDGRTQLFSDPFWQATYLGTPADIQGYLATQSADAALLPATHSRFKDSLVNLGWQSVYADDRAQVLIPPQTLSSSRY